MDSRLWPSDIPSSGEESALPPIVPTKQDEPLPRQLSAREIAIVQPIIRGDSNKHVARFFEIAEAKVKAHVKAIFRKIGATNRTQAAMWALNHGLLKGLDGARDIPTPFGLKRTHAWKSSAVVQHRRLVIGNQSQSEMRGFCMANVDLRRVFVDDQAARATAIVNIELVLRRAPNWLPFAYSTNVRADLSGSWRYLVRAANTLAVAAARVVH